MIGKTVGGRYRIERILGAGGMGSVYAAEDVKLRQRVAVKVIHADVAGNAAAVLQRFEREARAAGSIETEHICRCLDAGSDPETGHPYMVLEYLVGEDLQQIIHRVGPLSPQLALRVTAQALLGLQAAHQAGIVHRDIKPANIFLAQRAEGARRVKVLDFGVAKVRRDPTEMGGETAGLTRTGSLLGSPLYMSPEQARSVKNVDHRSDLWSLGIVLYQALAGRTPFDHISGLGDLIFALCSELPTPVQRFAPWVAPEVASVVDRALRIDLRERFQTAAGMLDAIRPLVPEGFEIRDELITPLDAATKAHVASTFFRDLDGAPRPGARAVTSEDAFADAIVTSPGDRAASTAPSGTTTAGGLGATQSGQRGAQKRLPVPAIVVVSVVMGGVGVYGFTRPTNAPAALPPAIPTVSAATADLPASASAVPTVAPVPSSAASSAPPPAAETATPVASASASARPAAPPPRAKPTAAPPRLDNSQFGGRK